MATQLRPNLMPGSTLATMVDPLQGFFALQQPVPGLDQSATVIRAWGYITSGVDVSAESVDFTCWDGVTNVDGDFVQSARQIGNAYTVGVDAVAAMGDPITVPFFLQWIDVAQTQSGIYVIGFDNTLGADIQVSEDRQGVLYPIAP